MGMTIEESLEWLISRKEHYEMDDNCQELAQALELAIEIMRKYQRIEQIIDDWEHDVYPTSDDALDDIERIVVEDGNDD